MSIALTEDNSDRLVERLREGQLDLALIGSAGEPASGVETAVILAEDLVAAVHPGHPPATASAIVPITSPPIRSRLELAWNSAPSANPAARALAEHAQVFVRQLTAAQEPQ